MNHKQEPSESERFDVVMRKLLTVSKKELRKREKVWERKGAWPTLSHSRSVGCLAQAFRLGWDFPA
jgi:hypothetical protein